MDAPRILVVEDEAIIALEIHLILESQGFSVLSTATSGQQAVNLAAKKLPDLVLMDVRIKGEFDGIKAAEKIRQARKIPVIFLTGNTDLISEKQLQQTKPAAVLSKPVAEWELLDAIESALNSNNGKS
ncbi:MAG: response regulator [Calditrichaeota bacterium]|nr:response regulator [Calditrichota bacterium]